MEWLRQLFRLFGRKNPQFESLTEFVGNGLKVRVWRTEANICEAAAPDRNDLCDVWLKNIQRPVVVIANEFGALPRVACIAIVDDNGNGVSYYPDWH